MPKTAEKYTERVQVLLTPAQYRRLRTLAKRRKKSLSAVMRDLLDLAAGRVATREERMEAVKRIASGNSPVGDWEEMERVAETRWEDSL
jgi:predicted transcriptional regulator